MVSSGDWDSTSAVNPRISENITEPRTRLPPSAKPDCCMSCATSEVAKRRTSSFCWSRRRFFSRLELMRALSSTGFTGFGRESSGPGALQLVAGAELAAARDMGDASERRGDEDRQIAEPRIADQLLEDFEAGHLRHLH